MKFLRKIFIVIFIFLLLIPVLSMNLKANQVSEITNSYLTEFDTSNPLSAKMLTAYLNDRIGFRDDAISAYTKLNDVLFDKMVHPSYTYGKDNHVFLKLNESEIDLEFIEAFCNYLKQIQDYCEARDVPFIYCVNPGKTTVYKDYLPEGYNYSNAFLDVLYDHLEMYQVNYVSNVDLLTDKAMTEQVYNKQYDAGHWNDLGQFYATNHLLEKISEYFPAVKPHSFDDFNISFEQKTSLPVSQFEIDETVPKFTIKNPEEIKDITDQYDWVEVDSQHPQKIIFENTTADEKLPRVLFFHGSYYNRSQEFYKSAFKETYVIHNYENILDFTYYFNIFEPECVVLETAEYATNRTYFNINKLLELNQSGIESQQ
mgnify:CR=1 FL=1